MIGVKRQAAAMRLRKLVETGRAREVRKLVTHQGSGKAIHYIAFVLLKDDREPAEARSRREQAEMLEEALRMNS